MLQDQSDEYRTHHNQNDPNVTAMATSTEDYLRHMIMKGNKQQTDRKLNELIHTLGEIHNDEKINKMGMERKETEPQVIQLEENKGVRHNERPPQSSASKAIDKRELCK